MTKNNSPFLQGNFAPWRSEDNFENLEIEGKIPEDLNGVLLRNGANPQFDPPGQYHWFEGDGMLHAIRIKNGNANYDNRWIRTERFKLEHEAGKALFNANLTNPNEAVSVKNASPNTANTNIVAYNRKLLALNEGALPVSIQLSNLVTIGDYNFEGQIQRRQTAHPRFDFKRKELMTYSYIDEDERLMYYRLDRHNKLISEKAIDWPYKAMVHDFVNTENYIIFPIFPCTMSFERMMQGQSLFMWEGDQLNTFFIITDKKGHEIMRIETDPCYVYHFANAYEEGDTIIIDAMHSKCSGLMPNRQGKVAAREDSASRLARWTINLKTKTIDLQYIDTITGEFPRFDERFNGQYYQHLYIGGRPSPEALFDRIIRYDLSSNTKQEHLFNNDKPCEPVFVPRSNKEGDGYLLTVVYRENEDRSDLVVLDAQHIDDKPLAVIKLPHRIPYGFHGNFVQI